MDYKQKPSKSVDMSAIVAEARRYEAERDRVPECGISSVEPVNDIVRHGITHAGVITHICTLLPGHEGDCVCCGYHWKGKK